MAAKFRFNEREYPIPEEFTLGELCDMEQHFGVVFEEGAAASVRQTAATLWISVRRVEPDVTPEHIRALSMADLEQITSAISAEPADPLETTGSPDSKNGSTGESSDASSDTKRSPQRIGSPG